MFVLIRCLTHYLHGLICKQNLTASCWIIWATLLIEFWAFLLNHQVDQLCEIPYLGFLLFCYSAKFKSWWMHQSDNFMLVEENCRILLPISGLFICLILIINIGTSYHLSFESFSLSVIPLRIGLFLSQRTISSR